MQNYFASDVGTPLIKTLQTGPATAQLVYVFFVLFAVVLIILTTVLLLLRKRIIKDNTEDDIFTSGF